MERGARGKQATSSPLVCLSRAPFSFLRRYFQAPATRAILFRTILNLWPQLIDRALAALHQKETNTILIVNAYCLKQFDSEFFW